MYTEQSAWTETSGTDRDEDAAYAEWIASRTETLRAEQEARREAEAAAALAEYRAAYWGPERWTYEDELNAFVARTH